MDVIQENKVFLKRNGKLLLFKHSDAYDGDEVNIEEYTKGEFLRYIAVKQTEVGIKLIYFYFANTSDQYFTQYGEWVAIEKLRKMPLRPATAAVLENYYTDGQYDKEIRVGTKNGEDVVFNIVTE